MPVAKGGTMIVGDDLRRFWSKAARRDSCIEWTGALDKDGYGKFMIGPAGKQKTYRPHRWLWELARGSLGRKVLRHKCDNPRCVNLRHLIPGTQKQNVNDCAVKGRIKHKLTIEQVREIRRSYAKGEQIMSISHRLGLGYVAVFNVAHRETWKHIRS